MIIDRYILREILKPLGVVSAILIAIFVAYTSARLLTDAVEGVLSTRTVLALVGLRTVIALEVLLPTTLFLSVIWGLGRLQTDYEMIALAAAGVPPARIVRAVGLLAVAAAITVAALSLYVRPSVYEMTYRLRALAGMEVDVRRIEAGRFYAGQRGGHVVFAERYDGQQQQMENVFVHSEEAGVVRLIRARRAAQRFDASGAHVLVALDGQSYRLDLRGDGPDRIVGFRHAEVVLSAEEITPEYRRKAATTRQLARSGDRMDLAELQWRATLPVSTLFLVLLGVPLSHTAPRRGRGARFGLAVLVYAVHFNLRAVAKTLVDKGTVGALPGVMWVEALLALVVAVALWRVVRGDEWTSP
jgi:lipopolysaccharide export system permease protein